ncbi:MAG: CBS domain-containing protein [Armatimonadota bacterium]
MKVREIMRTSVVTIGEKSTVREAVTLLSARGVSGLPVVDADGKMIGIVTEHDIIRSLLPTYEDILSSDTGLLDPTLMETRVYAIRNEPVSSIMTRNVVTLGEDDTIIKAASTMMLKKVKRLPVVRNGVPVGIVSRIDIVEALMEGTPKVIS